MRLSFYSAREMVKSSFMSYHASRRNCRREVLQVHGGLISFSGNILTKTGHMVGKTIQNAQQSGKMKEKNVKGAKLC